MEAFLMTSVVQQAADRLGRRPLLVVLPLLAMISTAALLIACKPRLSRSYTSLILLYRRRSERRRYGPNDIYCANRTIQIATYILLAIAGIFVSASTKAAFTPTLCISDLTDDDNRSKYYSRLESMALFGPCLAFGTSPIALPHDTPLTSRRSHLRPRE